MNFFRTARTYQTGVEGTRATVTLTVDTNPVANDTMTLGTKVYTFKASAAVDGEITVGANVAATQANIAAAIRGTDGINHPHPQVICPTTWAANALTITARRPGTDGNSIASTETFTAGTNVFSAATLTGGTGGRGTLVAATSKFVCEGIDFEETDNKVTPPLALGIAYASRGSEYVTDRGTRIVIPDFDFNYEQFQQLAQMVFTSTVPSGSGPYTWLWKPNIKSDPECESRTFERRLTDGVNAIDDEWGYVMATMLGLKWGNGSPSVRVNAEFFARRRQASTHTPGLSAPAIQNAPSKLVTVFADDAWTSLGGTQITAQILGGEFTYETGYSFYGSADGRSDLDFTAHQFDGSARKFTLRLTSLVKSGGFVSTERTKAETAGGPALRAIRVVVTGTGNRSLTIDGLYKLDRSSIQKVGEQDGQDVVEMTFEQSTDGLNAIAVTLVNNVANEN